MYIGRFDDTSKTNWIYVEGLIDADSQYLYLTSTYFTVTTLVTVGYGDITAQNMMEKIFCVFLMVLGVVAFSTLSGTVTSIMAKSDSRESLLKEKIAFLNHLSAEYNLDIELFNKLSMTIKYDHMRLSKSTQGFLEELPKKL